jgi:hypothetical protein
MKTDNFARIVARKITELGLSAPAVLLLEAHRPLAFVGSQLLLVAQPTLNLLMPGQLITKTIDLLADNEQFEELIKRLESAGSSKEQSV